MNLGDTARKRLHILPIVAALLALVAASQASWAAAPPAAEASPLVPATEAVAAPGATEEAAPAAAAATGAYTPLGPDTIKGQPTDPNEDFLGGLTFQDQYSPNGRYALWMHDAILLPLIVIISLIVLALLLWVVARYNRHRNANHRTRDPAEDCPDASVRKPAKGRADGQGHGQPVELDLCLPG